MAVVAVAGVALAVDKLILGGGSGPASVSAREVSVPRPEPARAPAPAATTLLPAPAEASRRLDALVLPAEGQFADAFAPPQGWEPPAPPQPKQTSVRDEVRPEHRVRLTAVITSGRPAARVDGRLVLVGGRTPEGLELVEVHERSARFRTPSGELLTVELESGADRLDEGPRGGPDGTSPTPGRQDDPAASPG